MTGTDVRYIETLPSGDLRVTAGPSFEGRILVFTVPAAEANSYLQGVEAPPADECVILTAADTAELGRQCEAVEELGRRAHRRRDDPMRDNDALDAVLDELITARARLSDTLSLIEIAETETS